MVATAASSAVIPMAALSAPVAAPRVAGYTGLKANSTSLISSKGLEWSQKTVSNGSRTSCMLVWTPYNNKYYETLSYLPDLNPEQVSKEIQYMINNGWFPCLEFCDIGYVYRKHNQSPGYYDGRYWTMWKLPLYGCTEPELVLKEVEECKKQFPGNYIRILGFDNKRQVQCAGFVVYKPS